MKVNEAAVHFDKLWKVADVAKFLQMSSSWVYKQSEFGLLPCKRFGTSLRFNPDEVRAYAAGTWQLQHTGRSVQAAKMER